MRSATAGAGTTASVATASPSTGATPIPLTSDQRELLGSAEGQKALRVVMRLLIARHGRAIRVDRDELRSIVYEQLVVAVRQYDPSRPGGLSHFSSYAGRYVYQRVWDQLRPSRRQPGAGEIPASAFALPLDELHVLNYPKPVEVRVADIGGDEERMDAQQREARQKAERFTKRLFQRELGMLALVAARVRTPEEEVADREFVVRLRSVVAKAMSQLIPEDREVLRERYWLGLSFAAIGERKIPPMSERRARRSVHIAHTQLGGVLRRLQATDKSWFAGRVDE
ncbi:MAG: hypothetical protein AAGA56_26135 [Myxococcota bacterium]